MSYDVMPPFVAARMLSTLYLPEGAEWLVRYIQVLKPIRFKMDQIMGARRERRALVLDDVAYVVAADLVDGNMDDVDHRLLFKNAILDSPSIHLGLASFPAVVRLLDENERVSDSFEPVMHDLGWMLYEIRNRDTKLPSFFRAQLRNGRIDLSGNLLTAI